MQQRRGQHVGAPDLTLAAQNLGQGDRVIDVGGGGLIFAALVAMLSRGKFCSFEYERNASSRLRRRFPQEMLLNRRLGIEWFVALQ
jgi:tRNA A58 N-methylase Trm61